jgi:MFS transporter, ACS family, tartrate transporter
MNGQLHFSATTYGLGAGLFFLSYAALELPSNLLLVRFGARRWLARIMFTWGVLAAGMLFVRTAGHLYVMRLLLGVAESGFFPGILFYLTLWFPLHVRARAVSWFYVAMPLSSTIMGVLAGALLGLDGQLGLRGWQWLFLLEGLPAVLVSVLFFTQLPDRPASARWLSAEERAWLTSQLDAEAKSASVHPNESLLRTLLNPRVLLLSLFFLGGQFTYYGFSFCAPAILQQLTGSSPAIIGYLIAGMGLLGGLGMLLNASHADRSGERHLHIAIPGIAMMVAYVVAGLTSSAFLGVAALAVAVFSYNAMQGPAWALPGTFLSGRSAAAGIAIINMLGVLGGFFGPYWMGYAHDLIGGYQRSLLTLAIPSLIAVVVALIMRRMSIRASAQR